MSDIDELNYIYKVNSHNSISFKKLDPRAIIPKRATKNSVGLDLTFVDQNFVGLFKYLHTGLAVQPPSGFYFEIHARSSLHKKGWMLANSVGIIDPDYRGELVIAICPINPVIKPDPLIPGIRVAQLILRKSFMEDTYIVEEEEELCKTERKGGFGSTGD